MTIHTTNNLTVQPSFGTRFNRHSLEMIRNEACGDFRFNMKSDLLTIAKKFRDDGLDDVEIVSEIGNCLFLKGPLIELNRYCNKMQNADRMDKLFQGDEISAEVSVIKYDNFFEHFHKKYNEIKQILEIKLGKETVEKRLQLERELRSLE